MKKIITPAVIFILVLSVNLHGQDYSETTGGSGWKKDQSKLFNDVHIGYGIGTVYLFTSEINHDYESYGSYSTSKQTDISSWGTIVLGYSRMMNKVIMIGFDASYLKCSYKMKYYDFNNNYIGEGLFNDNLLTGIAKITFNYVNKPIVRVYSTAGMGISVDLSNVSGTLPQSVEESARKILFAGQLVLMGVRFGREYGGFCEFGFGTNSIITAGFNYQFGD